MSSNNSSIKSHEKTADNDCDKELREGVESIETDISEEDITKIKVTLGSTEKEESETTQEYMHVDDQALSDTEINSESADLSDSQNNIGNTDDYYASGGSGSDKELQALKSDTKPKQLKSKPKSKTSVNRKGQRLITEFTRSKGTSKNKSRSDQLSYSDDSDTDPVVDSDDSDKEKTKTSKKKKMGNMYMKVVTRSNVKTKKQTRSKSSDSDDDFLRPAMYKRWSDQDTEQYRNGYPGKDDDPSAKANQEFYMNQRYSYPEGDKIDDIHKKWWGDYQLLERHHGYIQWLFPIRESGMNWHAQELQLHEAKAIIADKKAHARVLKSYEMMLDFYGIKLLDPDTGELDRGDNWKSQFMNLNRSMHNYLRITRILKSLGEFDYEYLKVPFVRFMINKALKEKTLKNVATSCMNYWVGTIKDDKERQAVREYAIDLGYSENKY